MNRARLPSRAIVVGVVLTSCIVASCSKKTETAQTASEQERVQSTPTPIARVAAATPVPASPAPPAVPTEASNQPPNVPVSPRDKVRERFTELFGDLRQPTVTADNLQAAWREFWIPELNETLPSTTNPDVAQGHRLPREIDLTAKLAVPFYEQVSTGTIPLARNAKESEAIIALYTLCVGACASGGRDLPTLLEIRAQQLPPTRGDVAVFQILGETLPMVGQQAPMSVDQVGGWVRLAGAPNPIYRLAALQAFARVSVDREQRLAFYRQYFEEREPLILKQLVDSLESLPSTQAPSALADLQTKAQRTGNPDIGAYAKQALDRIRPPQ